MLGAFFLLLVAGAIAYLTLSVSIWISAQMHGQSIAVASSRVSSDLLSLTVAQLLGMTVALTMGLRWFGHDASLLERLSLYAIRRRSAALCLLAGACLQFPLTELSNLLHHYLLGMEKLEQQLALQQMLEAPSLGRGLLVVSCVVAAIPVMEELFFRGFVLFGLRARYGNGAAIIGSACLFGVSHLDAVAAVYATVAGIVLGVLALRTGSIWPGIAVHAAVNAMPVLLPESLVPIRGFNVPSVVPLHLPPLLVVSALGVGCLLLAMAASVEHRRES